MKSKGRVMLVDDDPDHHYIFGNMLRNQGFLVYDLLGCEDLQAMMDAVLSFKPDLIFMDHNMPVYCGTQATRTLRSVPKTKNIPVIYFTSEQDIEALSVEAGADAYLRKPFKAQEMQSLLNLYL